MASNTSSDASAGKRILEELQQKASQLSTLLGSETATQSEVPPPNKSGSASRTYLPSFRRQFCNSSSSSNTYRARGKGKVKSIVKGPFMRDVILLTGPDVNKVPRQGKRVWLMENGFMISGFELQKEWSECVVEACLREAFEEKIPIGVDFEILMPVHSTLVKPTLAPGQSLNGVMVHRVFKEKPIYIRPFQEICDDSICSIKRYRESSPNQEDDFIHHTPKVMPVLGFGLGRLIFFIKENFRCKI